jgi:hypothetical protein
MILHSDVSFPEGSRPRLSRFSRFSRFSPPVARRGAAQQAARALPSRRGSRGIVKEILWQDFLV